MAFKRNAPPEGWGLDYATDTYVRRAELRITRRELGDKMNLGRDEYEYWMEQKRRELEQHVHRAEELQRRQMMMSPYPHDPYQQIANPLSGSQEPQQPQKQKKKEDPRPNPLLLLLEEEHAA
jgi:hypothetical protein